MERADNIDVAIVGGGAAGLAAAVHLARLAPALRVAVLEKADRCGRKLLTTGSGTCNISNLAAAPRHYHGAAPAFVAPALALHPPRAAMDFFSSIGLPCAPRADGRVYPVCLSAAATLDCLRLSLAEAGVAERCGCAVTGLTREKDGFLLSTAQGPVRARAVLVTAGGAASPAVGGCLDGYTLLAAAGHSRTPLFPSLVQLKTETTFLRAAQGVRLDVGLALQLDGRTVAAGEGELLFTEYGLSGPVALQVSRAAADWERRKKGKLEAVIRLLPSFPAASLEPLLAARRAALGSRALEDFLTGLLQRRLGQTVLRACGLTPLTRRAHTLTDGELRMLSDALAGWRIPVLGTTGFAQAQVTAGGVPTAEFDPGSLQSRLLPGLYAAGEVLDIDGDCGGFNLQWAWSSAYTAARAIAAALTGAPAGRAPASPTRAPAAGGPKPRGQQRRQSGRQGNAGGARRRS